MIRHTPHKVIIPPSYCPSDIIYSCYNITDYIPYACTLHPVTIYLSIHIYLLLFNSFLLAAEISALSGNRVRPHCNAHQNITLFGKTAIGLPICLCFSIVKVSGSPIPTPQDRATSTHPLGVSFIASTSLVVSYLLV